MIRKQFHTRPAPLSEDAEEALEAKRAVWAQHCTVRPPVARCNGGLDLGAVEDETNEDQRYVLREA